MEIFKLILYGSEIEIIGNYNNWCDLDHAVHFRHLQNNGAINFDNE